MLQTPKKDCPHIDKNNLLNIEEFKKMPFDKLKCKLCDEEKELWICLICGESFCSRNSKSHFIDHNKENKEHCLCINVNNLSVWCHECQENANNENNKDNQDKGCYIESEISNKYKEFIQNYKLGENEIKKENEGEENVKCVKAKVDKNIDLVFKSKNEICSHIKEEHIIDKIHANTMITFIKILNDEEKEPFFCLCLLCEEIITNFDGINKHFEDKKHKLIFNFLSMEIMCNECKSRFNVHLMKNLKEYKIIFQILKEFGIVIPDLDLFTKEEIYEMKYNKLIEDFKNQKYKNILFMVGAGISTSAGIPDFRSQTGLFKQLQDKYNLSSPEEFFLLSTFLQKPFYFYEFTKLFDLSKVNPTISHKFMNFFVYKNIVKYVFTQNIDGLEKKAKIPDEKLIFAHGNFYTGHCAKCKRPIDIEKINEGIEKGEIYYCPDCKGPCKPQVVFYGEDLPKRFYEKIVESRDIDLIIIMGTSLKVQPFASIPYLTNQNAFIILFNMDEVGEFQYSNLNSNSIFIKGKTDESVIKFLKDCNLLNEFSEFVKKEYNEELNDLIDNQTKMIDINEKKDEKDNKIEKLADDINNMNLNKK